jgi:hypothetical protein
MATRLPDDRPSGTSSLGFWLGLAGLPVLVYAEVFLRRTLEHAGAHLYSFLEYFYPAGEKIAFAPDFAWWRYLLPMRIFNGAWSISLVITHLTELRIGVPATWYLFNALLVVVSFAAAWAAFESMAFAYTFAICMGFGTHFYHAYAVTGGMASPLVACAFELALVCGYRFVMAERRAAVWAAAFVASLVATALCYVGWLDLAAFSCAVLPFLMLLAWRHGERVRLARVAIVAAVVLLTAVLYVFLKIKIGYDQGSGSESDVVFNYPVLAPAIEDVVSNIITQLYMSATNFLPPSFVSSTALYQYGAESLVDMQHGYHATFQFLVPMHYLFLWRFAAGALALALAAALVTTWRRAWVQLSRDRVALIVFVSMMWLAGSTHALIKIRPMKTTPVLGYHVLLGVLGAALLISYGVMMIWRNWRSGILRVVATAAIWLVLFYGALARPAMLNHLAAQSGLGAQLYPDPMREVATYFKWKRIEPGGMTAYELVERTPSVAAAIDAVRVPPLLGNLPPLPTAAPDLSKWTPGSGVKVSKIKDGYAVLANEIGGYQLMSPAIAVPRRHQLVVRASGAMDRGRICFGILDQRNLWLLAPDRGPLELSVGTGDNERVALVFTTCPHAGDVETPQFHVSSISYALLMNPEDVQH